MRRNAADQLDRFRTFATNCAGLKPTEMRVWLVLNSGAEGGVTRATHEQLMEAVSAGRCTVVEAVKRLRKLGFVWRIRCGVKGKPSEYQMHGSRAFGPDPLTLSGVIRSDSLDAMDGIGSGSPDAIRSSTSGSLDAIASIGSGFPDASLRAQYEQAAAPQGRQALNGTHG